MTAPDSKTHVPFLPTDFYGWCAVILLGFMAVIFIGNIGRDHQYHPPRGAMESALKSNLHQIRNAIDQFKADTGVYPAVLTDLTVKYSSYAKTKIPAGSFRGPYLYLSDGIGDSYIPVNPLKNRSDADYAELNAHWRYSPDNGQIHSVKLIITGKEGTTLDGIPYSEL